MTRRLVFVTGAVSVALIAAFWFAAWSPASQHLKSVHTQLATAQQDEAQLRTKVVTLTKAHRQLGTLRSELAALQAAVPTSPSLDTAVDQLASASAASGVTLPSVSASPPASDASSAAAPVSKAGGPQSITVGLSVVGGYAQTVAFVNRLEASPRLFVVDGVTLSPGGGGGGGAVTATVNTQMFYVPPTPAAPAPAVGSGK
ncbi:MAG TPA: type II secretion system protein GspM [Acidimicrobiales bacterium]|jgi:Tfp pilus assembly protein PilO|nr:type II secretion system protein GspM [Acidimicrobiales bacterium]